MPILISKRETDDQLRQRVKEISGEDFQKCYQCGTCSASCPMSEHISIQPRQIMALLQLGKREALEKANTYWVCASCHTCMARCPRDIDITKLMEALRLITLRENVDKINPNKIEPANFKDMPQVAMVSGFRKLTS